jgi:polar amino acid transport system ATP-binding protein
MLVVKHLNKSFGSLHVLKDISIQVTKGDVAVFIGPSGSGKTSLLRCINFLEKYDNGEIYVDEKLIGYKPASDGSLTEQSESEICKSRAEVGMVFQSFNLFPHMTVLKNVTAGPINVKKISKKEAVEIGLGLLEKVGLLDKKDEYPAMLSGGQQQRVAIARALAMRPKLMLFDEVTSALDPELVGEVLAVIGQLAKDGMTMVLVSHEMEFARDVANRIFFLDNGEILEEGPPKEIFSNAKTERLKSFLARFNRGNV